MGTVGVRIRRLRPTLKFFLLGGAAFWVPQILFHLWRRSTDRFELAVINALCPLSLVATYAVVHRLRRPIADAPSAAVYMLLGLWFLCPTFASVDFSFFGGGFASHQPMIGTLAVILYSTLVPPMTLITAWMAGQLVGFLAALFTLFFLHNQLEPEHWTIPPAAPA